MTKIKFFVNGFKNDLKWSNSNHFYDVNTPANYIFHTITCSNVIRKNNVWALKLMNDVTSAVFTAEHAYSRTAYGATLAGHSR